MRDGITLTKEFEDKKNYPPGPSPSNSVLILLNLCAFIIAIISLI